MQTQGVDLLPPQVFTLSAAEQETVTREVSLPEPPPAEFQVLVSAFNNFHNRQIGIFLVTSNLPPDSTITAPATDVTIGVGQTVTFQGTCTDPDTTTPFTFAWDFGRGGAAPTTLQNPGPVTFATAGTFTVTFTCTNALGAADPTPATRMVTVTGVLMADLQLWLRADADVTVDAAGGVISWTDQSGAGHSAAQSTPALRPLLVPGVLNSLPVLRFNGQNNWLGVAGQVLTSQQYTIVALVNDARASTDGSFREIFSNWSLSNRTTSVFFGTTNINPLRARLTDDFGGATDTAHLQQGVGAIGNPTQHFIFTGVSGATDALVFQGDNLIAAKGSALSPRDLASSPYNIGTQGTSFEFWQGDIAELLVYNRGLSLIELQQVWSYLQQKYSLIQDTDGDGLSNALEMVLGTNPLNPDTDGDGFTDDIEVATGTDPRNTANHPTLYDDFNAGAINPTRWRQQELVRKIETGQFVSTLAQFGNQFGDRVFNLLNVAFSNSVIATTLQADVSVTDVSNTGAGAAATLRRIPYNDGTPGGGRAGDIFLGVALQHFGTALTGEVLVQQCTNSTCGASAVLASHSFGPVALGTTHRLAIDFDGTRFTFGFDSQTFVFDPTPAGAPIVRLPLVAEQSLGTNIFSIDSPAEGASITATFDNVAFNGAPLDDFSSATLDHTKWLNQEVVRRIENGQLVSALTRFGSAGSNDLELINPNTVTLVQTDVTITGVTNSGALPRAGLAGVFYNDGTPGGGQTGDVRADIGIRHNGTAFDVAFFVARCDNAACATSTTLLSNTTTFGPVALGETHKLSLAWDGSSFIFGFDSRRVTFNLTSVAPAVAPARTPTKRLGTAVDGISGPNSGASLTAQFDNVVVVAIDTDGDGLSNVLEVAIGTNPSNPDTDGDGLSDGAEATIYHTNPLDPDTDGDGFRDGAEVAAGSDPLDPASVPISCVAPPAGLVSWLPGDGNATDLRGANPGTLQNGATFAQGKVGQAFSFDGVDDAVLVPHNANQNTGSQITIDAWVNPISSGHGRPIAQKRSPSNVGGYTFETTHAPFGPDNGLAFVIWRGGTSTVLLTPANVLAIGTWQHVAATYDGTAMKIYVDGVERASIMPVSGVINAVADPLVMGRNVVVPSFAWHGFIDEVEIHNRALTAQEIQAIFTADSAGKCKP